MHSFSNHSIPVVVLGSGHHGALGIVRSLGRLEVPVYVVEPSLPAVSSVSRYCSGAFCWDLDNTSPEESLDFLFALGRHLGKDTLLMPTTDSGVLFVAENASSLGESYMFSCPDLNVVQSLCSKHAMYHLAQSFGVPTPKSFFPQSRQEAVELSEITGFPLMLKTAEAWRSQNPAASSKVIVHSVKQLREDYDRMLDKDRSSLLLQEYISGGEDASWMFNGYFDRNSDCLFGATGRKIRQNRPYAGVTSLGECAPNHAVLDTTLRLMKALGYRGILDLGYRFDARDGTYKVFDINPRIGCTFRLFVADNGMDVARAQYLDLSGQIVDPGSVRSGRRWIVEDLDLASSVRYWRDGRLTISGWIRSFRGLEESAFFARDDLKPLSSALRFDFAALFRRLQRPEPRRTPSARARSQALVSYSSPSLRGGVDSERKKHEAPAGP